MAKIEINLKLRTLYSYKNQELYNTYPVAVGKPSTPTPPGTWKVINKIIHPGGILGTRWLGLDIPSENGVYGIHGTTQPWSIGKAVSLGCIRMYNEDIEAIFSLISIGTKVIIFKNSEPGYSKSEQYTVKPGDTLWKISQKFNAPLKELIEMNNIKNPDVITPGTNLLIPNS